MTFTKLIVGGFKSLRDRVEIPLAPITLMFGPNSAGKSSVLGAINFFRELLEFRNRREALEWNINYGRLLLDKPFSTPRLDEHEEYQDEYAHQHIGVGYEFLDVDECIMLRSENIWAEAGQLYSNELHGKQVELEYSSLPGELDMSWRVSVDQKIILQCLSFEQFLAGSDEFKLKSDRGDRALFPMVVCIHVSAMREAFLMRDTNHPDLIAFLAEMAEKNNNDFIWRDGDYLYIKDDWSAFMGVSQRLNEAKELFSDARWHECVNGIPLVFEFVGEFIYQLEYKIWKSLSIGHVSGGRGILGVADVEYNNLGFGYEADRDNNLSAIQRYARSVAYKVAGWPRADEDGRPSPNEKGLDFINAAFSNNLFIGKKYQIKADVIKISHQWLSGRRRKEFHDEEESVMAELFIEDGQLRQLGFDEVGSGVSYVLPVLASLWDAPRSWIEQPELHLHPAAQCEMGDVFVRAFNSGRFSIIETHSEHLLLRILRRIRETSAGKVQDRELACQPEAVAVLYFAPQEDGSTQVHQLRVTRGGDFMDRWPDGFFEERSRELFDE